MPTPKTKSVTGSMRAHAQPNLQRLARLEHVRGLAVRAHQIDAGDFDLARSPAPFDGLEHVRGLRVRARSGVRDPGLGARIWDPGSGCLTFDRLPSVARSLSSRATSSRYASTTRFGIALRRDDAAVEPQRLVAEPRHEVERVRDEQHRCARGGGTRRTCRGTCA